MEKQIHSLGDLFKQLGLGSDPVAIARFCVEHAPLPDQTKLANAPFWSVQQSQFLCESVRDDADWAAVVDQLDLLLRSKPAP